MVLSAVVVVASSISAGSALILPTEYQSVDGIPLEVEDEASHSQRQECVIKKQEGRCINYRRRHMCKIEIEYSFIPEGTNYSGNDVADIDQELVINRANDCVEKGAQWRTDFLNRTSLTIYYDANDPADNHYMKPLSPAGKSLWWVIGGLCVAVLFFFVGKEMRSDNSPDEIDKDEYKPVFTIPAEEAGDTNSPLDSD